MVHGFCLSILIPSFFVSLGLFFDPLFAEARLRAVPIHVTFSAFDLDVRAEFEVVIFNIPAMSTPVREER